MLCPKCGKEQPDNPKFCRGCGHEFETLSIESTIESATPAVPQDVTDSIMKKLGEGKKKKNIIKDLVKKGWSEASATQLIDSLERSIEEYKKSPEGRRQMASKYKRDMIFGLLWLAGGTIVTVATYSAASEGGTFLLWWGPIIYGAIKLINGFVQWTKYS